MTTSTATKIQEIFNDTIGKIINLVDQQNSCPSSESVSTRNKTIDPAKVSVDLIPILQTFLMNIQIYHTTTFNGLVNGISANVPSQSLLNYDIQQPNVSNKWQSQVKYSNGHIQPENDLSGFAEMELNDSMPIWPIESKKTFTASAAPPSYSSVANETRKHWGSRALTNYSSNYDDFLKNYTEEYSKYNTTYVNDSSSEGENEDTWKSLAEYVSELTPDHHQTSNLNVDEPKQHMKQELLSDIQCCARLSKYMKYRIADLDDDFVKSYPHDTYVEGGFVFGKPCLNKVSLGTADNGGYLCEEHINDTGIEDIRQPRPEIHSTETASDIVFSNKGYYTKNITKNDEWEGFDYYGEYDPSTNYSKSNSNLAYTSSSDAFTEHHQCCARLNKFRVYRLELESPKFLDTYPDDVYIEDGCIYGSACQNLISNESYSAGIRFCIDHESDPYVENICMPSNANTHTKLSRPDSYQSQTTANETSMIAESIGLEEQALNTNSTTTANLRRSSRVKHTTNSQGYVWNKYNLDFADLR